MSHNTENPNKRMFNSITQVLKNNSLKYLDTIPQESRELNPSYNTTQYN